MNVTMSPGTTGSSVGVAVAAGDRPAVPALVQHHGRAVLGDQLTATGDPDGWLGVLAVLAAILLIVDLAVERFSPQTQRCRRSAAAGPRRASSWPAWPPCFVVLKFLFHIHFDLFGFGFWVAVILTVALVYFAAAGAQQRRRADRRVCRPAALRRADAARGAGCEFETAHGCAAASGIAGVSALVLLIVMFVRAVVRADRRGGPHSAGAVGVSTSVNGWHALTDAALADAGDDPRARSRWSFLQATRRAPALPVSFSVIVTVLGVLTTLWLIYRVLLNVPGAGFAVEARGAARIWGWRARSC